MAKATIEVPQGMTPEKLLALLASFEKRNETSKASREKRNGAIKKLIAAHQPEYDSYIGKK